MNCQSVQLQFYSSCFDYMNSNSFKFISLATEKALANLLSTEIQSLKVLKEISHKKTGHKDEGPTFSTVSCSSHPLGYVNTKILLQSQDHFEPGRISYL